jgi:Abnormal spindle-like microcephaly-assoc'd, ASPM-SPD-2-Hydin
MRLPSFGVLFLGFCLVVLILGPAMPIHVSALRVSHDLPSSANGTATPGVCADNSPTPFVAALTGNLSSGKKCKDFVGNYPDYIQTLAAPDESFTLTIIPVLWEGGRQTILHLEFSSPNPNLALTSFVIGGLAITPGAGTANVPGYVVCGLDSNGVFYNLVADTNNTSSNPPIEVGVCSPATMTFNDASGVLQAMEPSVIQFADTSTTRWDIDGLAGSSPLKSPLPWVDLVVEGFPSDLTNVDADGPTPSNNLTQSFMANANNFLAVAEENEGGTIVQHTAGGLSIPSITTALSNDAIGNAMVITPATVEGSGFAAQINASTATPQQDGAGNLTGVPSPADPLLPPSCVPTGYTNGAVLRTAWFSYIPSATSTVNISTANSRYDTVLAVFTGTPGDLSEQYCDDDFSDPTTKITYSQAQLQSVSLTGGVNYYIMVGESPTSTGIQNNKFGKPTTPPVNVAAPLSNDATLFFSVTQVSASLVPTALATPAKLSFPAEAIGVVSASKKVTLSNTSTNGASLSVSSLFFTGANQTDFAVSSNSCLGTLAPGAKCAINVTFSPMNFGARAATLNIMDNATNSPQTVALSGTGPDFDISISPTSATVAQGQATSATVTLTPVNGFNQTISVTCAAPPSSTCSANPVTLDGVHAATTIVTITTSAKTPKNTYNTNVFGTTGADKHSTRIVITVD